MGRRPRVRIDIGRGTHELDRLRTDASKKLVIGGRDDNDTNSFNSIHDGEIAELVVFPAELSAQARGAPRRS